eukprot:764140-Hanusia_phi.AAC.2
MVKLPFISKSGAGNSGTIGIVIPPRPPAYLSVLSGNTEQTYQSLGRAFSPHMAASTVLYYPIRGQFKFNGFNGLSSERPGGPQWVPIG